MNIAERITEESNFGMYDLDAGMQVYSRVCGPRLPSRLISVAEYPVRTHAQLPHAYIRMRVRQLK